MTVSTDIVKSGPYSGNDVADEFSYGWTVTNKNQVLVYETTDLGVQTLLTVDTYYTVNNIGVDGGGTITRLDGASGPATPLPSGYTWVILANFQNTQETNFTSQGAFFPAVHEAAMDKLTRLVQKLAYQMGLTVKFADESSDSANLDLPTPNAGKGLKWNDTADGLENSTDNFDDIVTNAAASASAAATSETNAAGSESAAALSETAAGLSETAAALSETNAAGSESAAALSETAAGLSETAAALSETNAGNSASAASASETAAGLSETAAALSETNAAGSASAAATSETNAGNSETNAAASEVAAAASYDSFDDRYLGAKASDPALDNDGNALLTGALYWNTVSPAEMKVWNGGGWQAAAPVAGNADTLDGLDSTAFLRLDAGGKYSITDFTVSAETDESQRAIFAGGTFNGGDLTADTITDDDNASIVQVYQDTSGYNVSSFYTASVYIKKDAIGRATRFPMLQFLFFGTTTEYNEFRLDTATGEINTTFGSTAGVSGVESVGDYWRLYISAQSIAANTSARIAIFPALGASEAWSGSATATGSITAWGAIITEGDALLDYDAGLAANVITQPEDFDNAAWGKSGATVTANTDTAPDIGGGAYITLEGNDYGGTGLGGDINLVAGGVIKTKGEFKYSDTDFIVSAGVDESQRAFVSGGTFSGGDLTADTITDDSGAEFETISQTITGYNVASFYTASVYIKKDAIGRATRFVLFRLEFTGVSLEGNNIELDTATGEILTPFASTAGVSGIESVGDYWRVYISAQSIAANTTAQVVIYPSVGADAGWTFSSAATGSITAWGAIVTEGDALLDYDAGVAANVITQPEDFSNAAWTKSGATVTANTDKAPYIGGGAYITLEGNDYGGTGLGGDLILAPGGGGIVAKGNILDSNGNEIIELTATASAVNHLDSTNAATGSGPTLSAKGDDANIDLNLAAKGTGNVKAGGNVVLLSSTTSSDPGLAFGTWRTPNANRPTLVTIEVTASTDGSVNAFIQLEVDEGGGTTADYNMFLIYADLNLGAAQNSLYTVSTVCVPAGGSYRIINNSDPISANSIEAIRELTL